MKKTFLTDANMRNKRPVQLISRLLLIGTMIGKSQTSTSSQSKYAYHQTRSDERFRIELIAHPEKANHFIHLTWENHSL